MFQQERWRKSHKQFVAWILTATCRLTSRSVQATGSLGSRFYTLHWKAANMLEQPLRVRQRRKLLKPSPIGQKHNSANLNALSTFQSTVQMARF
jgi:hypothetical protein